MNPDHIPIGLLFVFAVMFVLLAIWSGFRLGCLVHRRSEHEKDSSASAISGPVLALVAFMLAFTFGIVAGRHDSRKGLVREEANVIRTAWQRADLLPTADRTESVRLLREYVDGRLDGVRLVHSGEMSVTQLDKTLADAEVIQARLWEIAASSARNDMHSPAVALYLESVNQIAAIHAMRVAIGLQQRIPPAIWTVLCGVTFCGMAAMGYQTGISGSRLSWACLLLAASFSLVVALIASLDRPGGGVLKASQQPLMDVQRVMNTDSSVMESSR